MKKILAMLLLVATTASADSWFEMPNQAGGKILLLDQLCEGKTSGKLVIATIPDGDNINGCWYYFADMVHIVWSNGKTSSFEPKSFTPKKSK